MRSIELTEWAAGNSRDVALVSAFIYAMRQQKMYAAPADFFDAAFEHFKNEVAA